MGLLTVVHECERKKPDGTVIKHPIYYRRYQTIIEQFKSGQTDIGVGTPLTMLPGMDAAKQATLKAGGRAFCRDAGDCGWKARCRSRT